MADRSDSLLKQASDIQETAEWIADRIDASTLSDDARLDLSKRHADLLRWHEEILVEARLLAVNVTIH